MKRSELREESAEYLNELSNDELFNRFEITRVADITGLDSIGVPVYSVCRPASKVISVNSGKSRNRGASRAGAIAEGIEFRTFENPIGQFITAPFKSVERSLLPLAKGSPWTPDLHIPQERVARLSTGKLEYLPSDLIWLIWRKERVDSFMSSSNGQAVGLTLGDAFLAGLYECVERDATVLRICSLEKLGVYPPRVSLDNAPGPICELNDRCKAASLKLYLLYCTVDIPIPVYWAVLVDIGGGCGSFAGWGCDLDPAKAAERAILEAIQGRAVYISGARDDILRRNFDLHKEYDAKHLSSELEKLPPLMMLDSRPEKDLDDEVGTALNAIGAHRDNLYFKHIDLGDLHAVKVIILGLEQPRSPYWKSMRWEKLREQYESQQDILRGSVPVRENAGTVTG